MPVKQQFVLYMGVPWYFFVQDAVICWNHPNDSNILHKLMEKVSWYELTKQSFPVKLINSRMLKAFQVEVILIGVGYGKEGGDEK